MLIKKRDVLSLLILIIECIALGSIGVFSAPGNLVDTMYVIGLLAVLSLIITSVAVYRIRKELNVFLIFIILCYFFSFGQCITVFLNVDPFKGSFGVARGFFSAEEVWKSSAFVFVSIIVTSIGYCLHKNAYTYSNRSIKKINYEGQTRLVFVSRVILIITIIPVFYNLYQDIITMSTLGYEMTLETASGITRVFAIFSGLFQGSLLVLYCFEEKYRKLLYTIIIAFFAFQLAGGSRIAAFRYAIVLLIISHLLRKEITRKKWIMIAIAGIGLIFVFSLVSSIRNYIWFTNDLNELIKTSVEDMIENNFFFDVLNEMGNTQCINTLVFSSCPDRVEFNYGFSYLRSIYGIIPNIFGLPYDSTDHIFSQLYTVTDAGMGSSYIAEGFWNFGYFSIIYYIFFGWIWGSLEEQFKKLCNEGGTAENVYIVVYLMFFLIFTVRTDMLEIARSFVYYCLFPILLTHCKFHRKSSSTSIV